MPFRVACLLLLISPAFPVRADEVRFRSEVMAVLSRGGCNQGACHANLHGKGGLKLSLRGENPTADYQTLSRDSTGRRVNRTDPDASLMLLKATGRVPHEGGIRFTASSPEYQIVRQWIAAGAPFDASEGPKLVELAITPKQAFLLPSQRLATVKAEAIYADGSWRDVTGLAVFDSTNLKIDVSRAGRVTANEAGETTIVVRYLDKQATAQLAFLADRPSFRWSAPPVVNYIDRLVDERLQPLRINPSDLCTDSEFIRRLSLDVLGVLPTPDETRRFLADADPQKRTKLIDAALHRPEYADWWALKWADLLRAEEKSLDKKGAALYHAWIRQAIADNKPLNEMTRELLAATGSTYASPPANYYRALREPNLRAEAMAQVFLGLRMQCAKCHNHPFNQWTQNDYHQLAAFFARVDYLIVENKRRDPLDTHEFIGEQIVVQSAEGEVKHPVTGVALVPRFLGQAAPNLTASEDRLRPLADWVADGNPLFARTQANRIWAHMIGKGLVDPIDDFRSTNPPSNEPLLAALAADFAAQGYDMKRLIRTIALSRTYQLSSRPNATHGDDDDHGSRAMIRPLSAEALLDAIAQVTEVPSDFPGHPPGLRAAQLPSLPSLRRGEALQGTFRFLKTFGKPDRLLSCDCERNESSTLNQTLTLVTGDVLNAALSAPKNRLGRLLDESRDTSALVEELFLAALCRTPSPTERNALVAHIDAAANRRHAAEDVLWGILNAKEFLLRK